MKVKRLREQKHWSQEQLAILSGLSVRTIQRIESGNRASLESLKSLAAVFDVDIQTLTEDIEVIDKTSAMWKQEPWYVHLAFWGVKHRQPMKWMEYFCLLFGFYTWVVKPDMFATPAAFLFAYVFAQYIQFADRKRFW